MDGNQWRNAFGTILWFAAGHKLHEEHAPYSLVSKLHAWYLAIATRSIIRGKTKPTEAEPMEMPAGYGEYDHEIY